MKCTLIFVSFFCLLQSSIAQYKAPLYMGFLMPKKYVRNLTNMQPRPKPNCGSVCPQQQLMISSQNFNPESKSSNFLSNNHQFNSFPSMNNVKNDEIKLPVSFQWEKNVGSIFNSVPSTFTKNDQSMIKFMCCGQNNNNRNQQNSYSNNFNRNANLYNKNSWETPSFDQWVKSQPQEGSPFLLYTGPQIQQNGLQIAQKYNGNDKYVNPQFTFSSQQIRNQFNPQLRLN